ncbi:MAG: hypothetical protein K2H45_03255, partial [Acetatifactor sp.]|nr:hypothetical protein [Acetatifactor sp.]
MLAIFLAIYYNEYCLREIGRKYVEYKLERSENTMSFTFIEKLPTPDEIREQYPLPQALAQR